MLRLAVRNIHLPARLDGALLRCVGGHVLSVCRFARCRLKLLGLVWLQLESEHGITLIQRDGRHVTEPLLRVVWLRIAGVAQHQTGWEGRRSLCCLTA